MQCTDNPAGWVLQRGLKSLLLKLCILLVSTFVNFQLFVSTEILNYVQRCTRQVQTDYEKIAK